MSARTIRLLIVEDDRDVAANIAEYFEARNAILDFAYDGQAALALARSARFDVVVLDLGLPRLEGTHVAARLRDDGVDTPILVLTARDSLDDKASAFATGVDDYLVKPFALAELEMRVTALIRRYEGSDAHVLQIDDLALDTRARLVRRAGLKLQLNRNQFGILERLMRASPNLVTKEELSDHLWGDHQGSPETLRAYIHELRNIVDKPFPIRLIQTIHSQGYALRNETDSL